MAMAYPKGPEIRALLLVKVDDGKEIEAAQRLTRLVVQQQWRPDWSIKRVDVVDLGESRRLHKFAPKQAEFNLVIAVKAAGGSMPESHVILAHAFQEIAGSLGLPDPDGLVVVGSFGADW